MLYIVDIYYLFFFLFLKKDRWTEEEFQESATLNRGVQFQNTWYLNSVSFFDWQKATRDHHHVFTPPVDIGLTRLKEIPQIIIFHTPVTVYTGQKNRTLNNAENSGLTLWEIIHKTMAPLMSRVEEGYPLLK